MRLRTILAIVLVLVVAVGVAAVAVILSLDPNDYKDEIVAEVEAETGRHLTIGGPIGFEPGLTTRIVLDNVALSNADWSSRPEMLTVGHLTVEVEVLPLIAREVRIRRLVLRDVDLLVETDAHGRSNLDFDDDAREDAGGALDDLPAIGIADVQIENVNVTIRDGATGATRDARLERVFATAPDPGSPLDVDIRGELRAGPATARIDLSGRVGSARAILSGREPVPVNLAGEVFGLEVAVDGGVRQPGHADEVDVAIRIAGDGLAALQPFVEAPLPAVGSMRLSADVRGTTRRPRAENIEFTAAKTRVTGSAIFAGGVSYDLTLVFDGQDLVLAEPYVDLPLGRLGPLDGTVAIRGDLETVTLTPDALTVDRTKLDGTITADLSRDPVDVEYDLSVSADGQSLAILAPFIGVDLSDLGPIDIAARLRGTAHKTAVENLSIRTDTSDLRGQGEIDFSGDVPALRAALESDRIDLTRLFPDTTPVHKPVLPDERGPDAAPVPAERIFSADPLPFGHLSALRADVSLDVGEFVSSYGTLTGLDLRAVLEDGVLDVRPLRAVYAGNPVTGDLSVDTRADTPVVSATLNSPSVDIGQLLKDLANLDVMQGTGALNIALSGSGESLAAIMGSLDGHARFLMGEGRMRNEGLGYVSGVLRGIGEALGRREWVVVECMANDFHIEGGVAESRVNLLHTEVITLVADGRIDLGGERYNLRITPSPRGLDLSLAVPVDVSGPLDDPLFSPNPVGTLARLGRIFGVIVFPPAALVGLVELVGSGHPCVEYARSVAEQEDGTPAAPLERGPGPASPLDVPGRAIEGVGEGLRQLFGR